MDFVARQAPLPLEFSRKEYWSGLPFPTPGDLPNPGIEHGAPSLIAGLFFTIYATRDAVSIGVGKTGYTFYSPGLCSHAYVFIARYL